MKNLHLLRSEPDETVRTLMEEGYAGDENLEVPLHGEGEPDYDELVRELFACDRVISWW
jgi:hypothetical protein